MNLVEIFQGYMAMARKHNVWDKYFDWFGRRNNKSASEEQCPVCGYYCLGKGGKGCINKPHLIEMEQNDE